MDKSLRKAIDRIGSISATARLLGIPRQAVQAWTVPPMKHVKRIAEASGVSEAELMRGVLDHKSTPKSGKAA